MHYNQKKLTMQLKSDCSNLARADLALHRLIAGPLADSELDVFSKEDSDAENGEFTVGNRPQEPKA